MTVGLISFAIYLKCCSFVRSIDHKIAGGMVNIHLFLIFEFEHVLVVNKFGLKMPTIRIVMLWFIRIQYIAILVDELDTLEFHQGK